MDGLAPTLGLAGTTGLGFGAGGGPLFPMTLDGRDPPGVDDGEPFKPLSAGAGAAGGGLLAAGGGGGGGGAACSTSLRLKTQQCTSQNAH